MGSFFRGGRVRGGDAFLGHAILLSEARLLTPRSSDRTLPPRYRTPHGDTHQPARGALPRARFSSLARCGANGAGGACLLCPRNSDVNLFRYGKDIIDLDAEVADGAFNFGVAERELHSSQITGAPVDQGCLCPS